MKTWIYRFFCVASIAIIITSIGYVKSNPHDYKECAEAAQVATLDDLVLEAGVEPVTASRQAKYHQAIIDNQIKCSDLGAQWGTANVALLGYIAGLLGLVFLAITVFETKSAAASASATLKIAQDTLNESKVSSKRELRAYLKVEVDVYNIYNTIMAHPPTQPAHVRFCVGVQNCGSTPAIDVEISFTVFNGSTTYLDEPRWAQFGDGILISPNQEVLFEYATKEDTLAKALKEKFSARPRKIAASDNIMVKVVVVFSDVFENRHTQVSTFGVEYSALKTAAKTVRKDIRSERKINIFYEAKAEMLLMASSEVTEAKENA